MPFDAYIIEGNKIVYLNRGGQSIVFTMKKMLRKKRR